MLATSIIVYVPGWNIDRDNLFCLYDALAITVTALVLNDTAFATTMRTYRLGLHLTKHRTFEFRNHTLSMAMGASLIAVASCTRATTSLARHIFIDFNLLFRAFVDFFKGQFHLDTEI